MSMGERPNSMSPTKNVYGEPPRVPYSLSLNVLEEDRLVEPGCPPKVALQFATVTI